MTPLFFRTLSVLAINSFPLGLLAQEAPLKTETELGAPASANANGSHRAPRGTFYLLSYASAKTDKGVEGFPPGQEVHFVSANQQAHTLLVSDGHAQVEVPPSQLTNDMQIAALVRNKDAASQAQVAAYAQAEQEAYNREQAKIAENTAKDLEKRNEKQVAATQAANVARAQADGAQPTDTTVAASGYYGDNGTGYGSPYSYFTGGPVSIASPANSTPSTPTAPAANAPSTPNKVAVPSATGGNSAPGKPK